ncbi:hypothetical protein [Clostridium botulinum]|uniref:hypothetical protein n=1 Tax=Clostridium botulinum TaxID=1491 RepID=UPI00077426FB|nr:hypothetical protein [Clostridium botulinum]NFE96619.1 hypothetical protein [Clostridium botulinum]NFL40097.1 hypothetical protein [Clostridium botulinum]NFL67195.1 hypothetical protein [Clostridium botulinum]NFN09972.1 hypothetical protein [Clostridium botulinum]NFN26759.1 hypothetical protein [Clostridium botulinum]
MISNKVKRKEIEQRLYDYKSLGIKIKNIDLQINSLENEMIKREEFVLKKINRLNDIKNIIIDEKSIITWSLKLLNNTELELIKLRYFSKDKLTWLNISFQIGYDVTYCMKLRNKIIDKLYNYLK